MRKSNGNRDQVSGFGVDGRAAWGVEADLAFLRTRSAHFTRARSSEGEMYSDIEPFVVHFVEVEHRTRAPGW